MSFGVVDPCYSNMFSGFLFYFPLENTPFSFKACVLNTRQELDTLGHLSADAVVEKDGLRKCWT